MPKDQKTLLAQELARSIIQFRRLEWQHDTSYGLRHSEFILLATILHYLGPNARGIRASDLSARLMITPAGVTHMINSLEEGGYVERLADPTDRRVVLVKPTEKGKRIVEKMNAEFLEALKGMINFLGEQASREFIRLLSLTFSYVQERRSQNADKIKS